MRYWILNDALEPVPVASIEAAADWLSDNSVSIGWDVIGNGDVAVSTVFLSIKPVWETLVIPDDTGQLCEQYDTHAEAVEGHARWVATMKGKNG